VWLLTEYEYLVGKVAVIVMIIYNVTSQPKGCHSFVCHMSSEMIVCNMSFEMVVPA
jgi:hypothetical protein